MTGLSSFFRWESRWHTYRQSQFSVDQLLTDWRLTLIEAQAISDVETAKSMILDATKILFDKIKNVRDLETKIYFENVQWPQTENKKARNQKIQQ